MNVDFPYHMDSRGHSAAVNRDGHIRDLIEQVLFTSPGERVNRPDFGTGLMQLVFAPNSDELTATLQLLVSSALQQALGERIRVDEVTAKCEDSVLSVSVRYALLINREAATVEFMREV